MSYSEQRWQVGKDDIAYGHSTGRLRLLEAKLLTAVDLEAAIRQGDLNAWQQLLDRLAYPKADDALTRIALSRQESDKLLIELSTEKVLAYALLMYQNYHNIKVFLKAMLPSGNQEVADLSTSQAAGIPDGIKDLLFMDSYESLEDLWKVVLKTLSEAKPEYQDIDSFATWTAEVIGLDELGEHSYIRTHLPVVYSYAIAKAKQAYVDSNEVGRIDAIVDQYYFAHLAALGRLAKQDFIRTYAGLRADIANMNSLYRAILMNLEPSLCADIFVPGGQILTGEQFIKLMTQGLNEWKEAFANTKVVELVELAYSLAHPSKGDVPVAGSFARKADNLVMNLARTGLEVIYGPQVVAGYWLARQTEAQNLRVVLSLLAQGKTAEEILALLREAYIHG